VEVLFDGVAAESVSVANSALLYVVAPVSPLSDAKTGSGAGPVSVTVRNIDSNGDVISGETVTAADAFEYIDVKLTDESELARVIRSLIRAMRQQILPNVTYSAHTDYDAETGDQLNIVTTAGLPALSIIGPTIEPNRFYSKNHQEYVDGHGHSVLRRVPFTGDLRFTILGIANKSVQLLNLQSATVRFFDRTRYFRVLYDPNDLDRGYAEYDMCMDLAGGPSIVLPGDDANVRSFEMRITIKGFDIETLAGFDGLTDGAVGISEAVSDADDAITLTSETVD
jgi:hypothetical protein